MSYEIVYARNFIRTTKGIIPVVLMGSNNCSDVIYDTAGRRREVAERLWAPIRTDRTVYSEEQLMTTMQGIPEDTELFMFRGNWVTGKDIGRWLKNGIKAAYTVEEYLTVNPGVHIHCCLDVCKKGEIWSKAEMEEFFNSTADMEAWIDKAEARKAKLEKDGNGSCTLIVGFTGRTPLNAPQNKKRRVLFWQRSPRAAM